MRIKPMGHFHWQLYHIRVEKKKTRKGVGLCFLKGIVAEREKGFKIMKGGG